MSAEITVHSGSYGHQMKLVDLHIHTDRTDGWLNIDRLSGGILDERGLSALAFTDHDDLSTGYDMREQFVRKNLPHEIIPGVEVTAKKRNGDDAHILGLYLEDDIKKYQSVGDTVFEIIRKGGIVVFPHPGHPGRSVAGVPFNEIVDVAKDGAPVLIETFNAGLYDLRFLSLWRGNQRARSFYEENRDILVGQTGGTDAHFRTVGRGLTAYDGDLRTALERGETSVVFRKESEKLTLGDLWRHHKVIMERARLRKIEEAGIIYDAPEEALAPA